jgi:hypothetical protein
MLHADWPHLVDDIFKYSRLADSATRGSRVGIVQHRPVFYLFLAFALSSIMSVRRSHLNELAAILVSGPQPSYMPQFR